MNSPKHTPIGADSQIDRNLLKAGQILRACIKLEDLDATSPKRPLKPNYSLKEYDEATKILEETRWWSIPFLVVQGLSGLKLTNIGVGSHSDMVHIILIGGAHAVLHGSTSAPPEVTHLATLISGCASAERSAPMLDKALVGQPQKALAALFEALLDGNTKITGKLFDAILGAVAEGNLSDFYKPRQSKSDRIDGPPGSNANQFSNSWTIIQQLEKKSTRSMATAQLAKAWCHQLETLKRNFQERSEKP